MATTKMKDKLVTPQQIKALQIQLRQMGLDAEERHAFINNYTNGRTNSTAALTMDEARALLNNLAKESTERTRKAARNIVRQIFALSFQVSFLNKGFSNDTKEDFEMNKAKLNAFCRNRTKIRKNITDMTLDELKDVKLQLEALARKEA